MYIFIIKCIYSGYCRNQGQCPEDAKGTFSLQKS